MKYIPLFLCLIFVGCASNKVPAVIRVDVPVSVPCVIKQIDKPDFAVDGLSLDADTWDMMAALRAERVQRKAYEKILESAIHACQ